MQVTFGCIIIHNKRSVLLVKEEGQPYDQLERWNLVSGKVGDSDDEIFNSGIEQEVNEETGVSISVKGLVAVYENIGKKGRWLYLVIGADALTTDIQIHDADVVDAQFIDLDEFYEMSDDELAHPDMKKVVRKYIEGKYIDQIYSANLYDPPES